jgi:hypothetical protein
MARKRKTVTDDDGTPVEVETAEDLEAEAAELDDELAEVFPEGGALTEAPAPAPAASGRVVIWTEKGEAAGVFSEHGQHVAGEEVTTEHADVLIANGFATEKA